MALHIQMSEEAERELRRSALRNQLSSILASLLVMCGGGAILFFAVILIVQEAPAVFVSYVPPTEDLPPSATPTTRELSSRAATPSSSVSPTVIVSTSASAVQMASVEIEAADIDLGSGIDIDMGMDAGLGDGLGDGGAGLGSGTAGGSALVGTYYDLKLTRSGARSALFPKEGNLAISQNPEYAKILHQFTRSWSPSVLERYWKSPAKLYASSWYMPHCSADYAPLAFQCDPKKNLASAFAVVYRGKVRAPKSGTFRFVGAGDDMICVRFNRKTVLEAGWCIPSMFDGSASCLDLSMNRFDYMSKIKEGKDPKHRGYEYVELPNAGDWMNIGGLTAGTPFEVKEGQVYPIEILVSEVGGAFGFFLFIEDMKDSPQAKKPVAERRFDLFRTNFSLPDADEIRKLLGERYLWKGELKALPYNPDSLIWVAVP